MSLEADLLEAFLGAHPVEAARILESMPTADAAEVMDAVSAEVLAALLPSIAPVSAANTLQLGAVDSAALALSATRPDAAAAILRAMTGERRNAILSSLHPDAARKIKPLLRYSDGTAGALLDPQVLCFRQSSSVAEALGRIRRDAAHALYYAYVVSEEGKLVGVTTLRALLAARPDQNLGLVASPEVVALSVGARWETIATHPAWNRVHELPVTESDGRFVGVIRYEAMREIERRIVETQQGDDASRTAAAVGELYGVGLRGLADWALDAFLGESDSEGELS